MNQKQKLLIFKKIKWKIILKIFINNKIKVNHNIYKKAMIYKNLIQNKIKKFLLKINHNKDKVKILFIILKI